jgi:malate dehydrogenase|tara:strand:- start:695 stop:1486 length:792 start_codon:yes stop_codon:yes gene_type:complete
MERKDVMAKNVGIFNEQGSALSQFAKPTVKCVVVGNPANTNAAILARAAPGLPTEDIALPLPFSHMSHPVFPYTSPGCCSQFHIQAISCLTRLDQNRAQSMVARKMGVSADKICRVIIWGNHSSTQYPDLRHATGPRGESVMGAIDDQHWVEKEFVTTIQKRGAAVIAARKLSSAASAAKATADHLRDWTTGTEETFSMGVYSDGSKFGIPAGIYYSMPHTYVGGALQIVEGLPIDEFSRKMMDATAQELVEELSLAQSLLDG